jgi:hypothetical protein
MCGYIYIYIIYLNKLHLPNCNDLFVTAVRAQGKGDIFLAVVLLFYSLLANKSFIFFRGMLEYINSGPWIMVYYRLHFAYSCICRVITE